MSLLELPLVYIAGPYTNPDPVSNTRAAIRAGDDLLDVCVPVVPHLSLLWHLVCPHDIEHWYEYDLAILARCDALLRLPGASSGADNEVAFAVENRLPVFMSVDALRDAVARREIGVGPQCR